MDRSSFGTILPIFVLRKLLLYNCLLVLDSVAMHEIDVSTCCHDVSMKFIHARFHSLICRIFELVLHA